MKLMTKKASAKWAATMCVLARFPFHKSRQGAGGGAAFSRSLSLF